MFYFIRQRVNLTSFNVAIPHVQLINLGQTLVPLILCRLDLDHAAVALGHQPVHHIIALLADISLTSLSIYPLLQVPFLIRALIIPLGDVSNLTFYFVIITDAKVKLRHDVGAFLFVTVSLALDISDLTFKSVFHVSLSVVLSI